MLEIDIKVISLPSSAERRAATTENLRTFPLSWTYFDGLTDDDDIGLAYNDEAANVQFGRSLSRAERGCFKSHYTVLKTFAEQNPCDWLIVFEDDLVIDTNFDFAGLIAQSRSAGIPALRLYCRRWKTAKCIGHFSYRQIMRFKTDPYGIQCYIMNRAAARAIVANIVDIRRPIDDEIGRFWEHGVDIVGVFPFPVLERSTPSTLEESRETTSSQRRRGVGFKARRMWVRSTDKLGKNIYNAVSRLVPGFTVKRMFG